jgi:hypothetical protein
MDEYKSILTRVFKKREIYIKSNDMVDIHDFEKFIHREYKTEILKLINGKNIKSNSDLIKLNSGKKKKKKKTIKKH